MLKIPSVTLDSALTLKYRASGGRQSLQLPPSSSTTHSKVDAFRCSQVVRVFSRWFAVGLLQLLVVLDRLHVVQNNLARTVLNVRRRDRHVSDILRELHWLPIRSRIEVKIASLCYKANQSGEPSYLSTLLKSYTPFQSLRSSD